MTQDTALVLVVDDNEMNRDMLSRRLKRQNYEVVMAEDGRQALDLLKQREFDLMLLDIMMPNLSGYEVLETVKADPTTQHIPVIMISAVDDLDSVVRCIELGAEDYLFKPFNPVLLKARVNASLARKRNQIDLDQVHQRLQALTSELHTLASTGIFAEQVAQLQQHVKKLQQLIPSA